MTALRLYLRWRRGLFMHTPMQNAAGAARGRGKQMRTRDAPCAAGN